jgi:hypothetical protein
MRISDWIKVARDACQSNIPSVQIFNFETIPRSLQYAVVGPLTCRSVIPTCRYVHFVIFAFSPRDLKVQNTQAMQLYP